MHCQFTTDGCGTFGGGGHWTGNPIVPDPNANAAEAAEHSGCDDCYPEPYPEPVEPAPSQGSDSPNTGQSPVNDDDVVPLVCRRKPNSPYC